jgi:hypothetical protein
MESAPFFVRLALSLDLIYPTIGGIVQPTGMSAWLTIRCYRSIILSWKYTLFLAMDANFRLRRKKVSSESKDPALNQGYGYFVNTLPYIEHIEKHTGEKQAVSLHAYYDASSLTP